MDLNGCGESRLYLLHSSTILEGMRRNTENISQPFKSLGTAFNPQSSPHPRNTATEFCSLTPSFYITQFVSNDRQLNLIPSKKYSVWIRESKKEIHRYFKCLGARMVTWRKLHTEDPQILVATVQNSVVTVTWPSKFVQHLWGKPHHTLILMHWIERGRSIHFQAFFFRG